MKPTIIVLLLGLSLSTMAQSAKLNTFYAKYKHSPNTLSIALPGWLVKLGINLSEDRKEINEYRPLLRGLHNMKVLVMEEKNYASPKEVNALIKDAQKHHFVNLLTVKEGGTRVNVMVREKKTPKEELIKNVLFLVAEEDELVLVTFNGRWRKSLVQKMLEKNEINLVERLDFVAANDESTANAANSADRIGGLVED
ncbi:DUF4252 domain-containing protein [Aureispira anguillae]|uniref:DUF4252 domain-containing protein n=1 Tax=Aureispira anguillae TaxID=2864201 RepID=A0A916DTR4_9BACT|nr:DUF4252 domain-containing protein [Aureispira anguillae]BDS12025.1 DUF4252 domain-containing protein [Aureispira anguillae]